MNTRVALDALLGFVIALSTPMLALLAQKGVEYLSDISQAAYAAAFIGAIASTCKLISSRLADSPANVRQTDAIVDAAANLDTEVPE